MVFPFSDYILLKNYLPKQIRHDLIYESIKTLKIRTSIAFNLFSLSNTISSCFIFFFVINVLYFLISALIAEIFIPTTKLIIPTGTKTNEVNTEIQIQTVTVETQIKKCSSK